ncbi:MAG: hypothetical protein KAQ83_00095 [Nanoarchaeota archaeon]|nr:hypothetical protein [Nanoarchaeota archaeon]
MEKIKKYNMKKDLIYFGVFLALFFIFLKSLYYKESILVLVKFFSSYVYLYFIPGFLIMINFHKQLDVLTRLVLAIGIGFSVQSLLVYYINWFTEIPFQQFYLITPLIISLIAGLYFYKSKLTALFKK